MTTTIEERDMLYVDSPSLTGSLSAFDDESVSSHLEQSPTLRYPTHRSGFCDSESGRGSSYSPPAFRREEDISKINSPGRDSGFWRRRAARVNPDWSLEGSPDFESADEGEAILDAARRTRLPTGSLSPSPELKPEVKRESEPTPEQPVTEKVEVEQVKENGNSYVRFAFRAEVQHRTDPLEVALAWMRSYFGSIARSWKTLISATTVAIISILVLRMLFQPAAPPPSPDLVKVAGLAKAFEPLIFYSENGIRQVSDLQATGVAVWDLGETVRTTNMTSGPIIVKELDDLSESLKNLAVELTRFFANVDGDVDGILIVMDWAKRELSQLNLNAPSALTSAFDNLYTLLSHTGLFETADGTPTRLGLMVTSVFGLSSNQRNHATLQRLFAEFLSVLEEAIDTELQHSLALFALFESADKQFLNLGRTVARELSAQENAQDDMLSSLWSKILGPSASRLAKFDKNCKLLTNIRTNTVQTKSNLLEHNRNLLTLKANLESLRRKVISPLLRGNSSTLSIEEQIRGLEDAGGHLGAVREKQKARIMEMLYGAGYHAGRRVEREAIEGRY